MAFYSDFRTFLHLPVHSFSSLSFTYWYCILLISSLHRYFYVFICSSYCIFLLFSNIKFRERITLPLFGYNICTTIKPKFLLHITTEEFNFSPVFGVLSPFYLSALNRPCKASVITSSLLRGLRIMLQNLFNCYVRGVMPTHNNSGIKESPSHIPHCIPTFLFLLFSLLHTEQFLIFQ